jgi:hypothetical protein
MQANMLRAFYCLLLMTCYAFAFGQGKWDANWCFGKRAGIHFSDTTRTTFITKCDNHEPAASISDSMGNLLFYMVADESIYLYQFSIYDGDHNLIINGDSLLLDFSTTNGAIILPDPNFKNEWYVFHIGYTDANRLYQSKVIRENGSFRVIYKNVLVDSFSIAEKLTAVKHANGTSWWIFTHRLALAPGSNEFISHLITNSGISRPFIQKIGQSQIIAWNDISEMIVSKDGNKLISCLDNSHKIEIYNLDRCTGWLSNRTEFVFSSTYYPYAVEIVNNVIYISMGELNGNALYQLKLNNISNAIDSVFVVSTDTINNIGYGQLELGPDGKIYLAVAYVRRDSSTFFNQNLSVINHPGIYGIACDFQPNSFYLGDSAISFISLPNMPNYNLGSTTIYQANAGIDTFWCLGDTIKKGVHLGSEAIAGVTYEWLPAIDIDSPQLAQQFVSPTHSTWYYLTITDTTIQNSCQSRTDSVYVEVKICTGINEPEQGQVKVYPNPANEQLIIETARQTDFILYDIMGRQVKKELLQTNKTIIDVSALPEGLYVYRIGNSAGKVQVLR